MKKIFVGIVVLFLASCLFAEKIEKTFYRDNYQTSAVMNGKCLNTSMGLTPNAGLIMGSRSGDIDATIIPYIMNKVNTVRRSVRCGI